MTKDDAAGETVENGDSMVYSELDNLNYLALRADHVIHEGHPEGLGGLYDLERKLLGALGVAEPIFSGTTEYQHGMAMLESLRYAIEGEQLLEGEPLYEIRLLI